MLGIGKKKDEEKAVQDAYEIGYADREGMDRGMAILESPTTNDAVKFLDKATRPARINGAPATKLALHSFSTTNYPQKIGESFELYTARNQISALLICMVQPLQEKFPDAGFDEYLSTLLLPLEVDNMTRRSDEGMIIKEVGTKRAVVEQKKPQPKATDLIRRD